MSGERGGGDSTAPGTMLLGAIFWTATTAAVSTTAAAVMVAAWMLLLTWDVVRRERLRVMVTALNDHDQ